MIKIKLKGKKSIRISEYQINEYSEKWEKNFPSRRIESKIFQSNGIFVREKEFMLSRKSSIFQFVTDAIIIFTA